MEDRSVSLGDSVSDVEIQFLVREVIESIVAPEDAFTIVFVAMNIALSDRLFVFEAEPVVSQTSQ